MDTPDARGPLPAPLLRRGAHAELVAVADAVLGPEVRTEVSLVDLVTAAPAAQGSADVVWAGPDDLALVTREDRLAEALVRARTVLRAGGLLLLPVPEPAELKAMHAVAPVAVQVGADGSAGPVGVWDFAAGGPRQYSCQQLVLRRGERGVWAVEPGATTWFEVPEGDVVSAALVAAAFLGVQRLPPSESGLSCAVWAAVAPSGPV